MNLIKMRPASDTLSWRAFDREHHLRPFTDTKALAEEGCRVITRADGVYIRDSDGKKLLDGLVMRAIRDAMIISPKEPGIA